MVAASVPNPPVGFSRVVPHLVYDDVDAAARFLCEAFGFRERIATRHLHPDGSLGRTQLELLDSVITLGTPSIHGDSPRRGVSSMLYIYIDDVDGHYHQAQAAGAKIVSPLEDVPWGDRRYQAADAEGHQWTFAEHVRNVVDEH